MKQGCLRSPFCRSQSVGLGPAEVPRDTVGDQCHRTSFAFELTPYPASPLPPGPPSKLATCPLLLGLRPPHLACGPLSGGTQKLTSGFLFEKCSVCRGHTQERAVCLGPTQSRVSHVWVSLSARGAGAAPCPVSGSSSICGILETRTCLAVVEEEERVQPRWPQQGLGCGELSGAKTVSASISWREGKPASRQLFPRHPIP